MITGHYDTIHEYILVNTFPHNPNIYILPNIYSFVYNCVANNYLVFTFYLTVLLTFLFLLQQGFLLFFLDLSR